MIRLFSMSVFVAASILSGCAVAHRVDHGQTVQAQPLTVIDEVSPVASPAKAPTALRVESFLGDQAASMDEQSRRDFLSSQQTALDRGGFSEWTNASIGAHGQTTVTPSPDISQAYPELVCRGYSSTVWVLGSGRLVTGDACRQSDGTWLAMTREQH